MGGISFCRLGLLLAALVAEICPIISAVNIAIVTASAFDITIIRPPFKLQLLVLQFLASPSPFTRFGSSQLMDGLFNTRAQLSPSRVHFL
jgi:hypothetical protein